MTEIKSIPASSFNTALNSSVELTDNEHAYLADSSSFLRKKVEELAQLTQGATLPSRDYILFDRVKTTLQMTFNLAQASASVNAPIKGRLKKALVMVEIMLSKYNGTDLPISELRDVLTLFQQIVGEYATNYNVSGTVKSAKWYNKWI